MSFSAVAAYHHISEQNGRKLASPRNCEVSVRGTRNMRKPVSRLSEQTGLASRQTGLQADLPGLGFDLHPNPSPSPNKPVGAGASPFGKPKNDLNRAGSVVHVRVKDTKFEVVLSGTPMEIAMQATEREDDDGDQMRIKFLGLEHDHRCLARMARKNGENVSSARVPSKFALGTAEDGLGFLRNSRRA
ncbi:hypothetical protein DFH09DRAFT_1113128 [Mycena vulgaris]|nr:hypothetical protein DFH09DRAFT_1113128 [Mycena vulgaris]